MCVCVQYVVECFQSSSLFHKALKEAFESFCNKTVSGTTMAELMANFCNNLLKRVNTYTPLLSPPPPACCMELLFLVYYYFLVNYS